MLRFAVVGSPVAHSKSPTIHALFGRQTGVNLKYDAEEVCAQSFDNFVIQFLLISQSKAAARFLS